MATVRLYLDTRRTKTNGEYPVKIGVKNQKDILLSTGVSCRGENWSNGIVLSGDVQHKTKNASLQARVSKINLLLLRMESDDELNISDKTLRQRIDLLLKGKVKRAKTVLAAIGEHMGAKTKENTILSYMQTMEKIRAFDEDVTLDDIDKKWLSRFEAHLSEGLSVNSIAIHMRNLRAAINYAIDEEYTNNYPFRKFKIKTRETVKRSLTPEQLRKLRIHDYEPHMRQYRDIFMLTFFLIGINPVDLFNVKEIKDGRIEYYRSKTDRLYSIKVEPEALEIINRYKGKKYLLDIRERYSDYRSYNSKLNKMLKQFGKTQVGKKGKKKHTPFFPGISIYWARHTWATIASSLDIPKETISMALGHGTKTVTDIYINFDMKKVDEANRRVIDEVMGKQ